jgi:thiaminase
MGNSKLSTILGKWKKQVDITNASPWFQKLAKGELTVAHYMGFLLETYHHAGLNPQIQAFTTMFLKNNPRDTIKLFFKHATSEIGHDLLALDDLCNLGPDKEKMIATKPLPSTVALNAYVLYTIQFVNPMSYLGYLLHLEYLPTQNGPAYIDMLKKIGVPENALSFLEEHATVDVGHNGLMEKYFENLKLSEKDLEDITEAACNTCVLHRKMIEDAFANGEKLFSSVPKRKAV